MKKNLSKIVNFIHFDSINVCLLDGKQLEKYGKQFPRKQTFQQSIQFNSMLSLCRSFNNFIYNSVDLLISGRFTSIVTFLRFIDCSFAR